MSLLISMGCIGVVMGMLIAIGLLYLQMYRLSQPPECELCGARIVDGTCEFCGQEWKERR